MRSDTFTFEVCKKKHSQQTHKVKGKLMEFCQTTLAFYKMHQSLWDQMAKINSWYSATTLFSILCSQLTNFDTNDI